MTKPAQSAVQPITHEAHQLVNGARRSSYGPADVEFAKVAAGWSQILNAPVTSQQVALCMIWLKTVRESNSHSRDNLVDICGYAELLDTIASHPSTHPPK